jgi:nucleoside phosphorylase
MFGRIYLHFFDTHYLALKTGDSQALGNLIYGECRRATRFSVLACDEVLVPIASFYESPECFKIVSELKELFPLGFLNLVGSGMNVDEFVGSKLSQYPKGSVQFGIYKNLSIPAHNMPPFLSRRNSSTTDISAQWLTLGPEKFLVQSKESAARLKYSLGNVEKNWLKVPGRLDQSAFIVPHITPLLFDRPAPNILLNRLAAVLNESYFLSSTREFCAGVVTNLIYLAAPHPVPSFDRDLPYKELLRRAHRMGILAEIDGADIPRLLEIRKSERWRLCLAHACRDYEQAGGYLKRTSSNADIGIVTALPVEFAAVCAVFGCEELPPIAGQGAGRKYASARLTGHVAKPMEILVCLMTTTGNNSAAIRATQMITHFPTIRNVLMVGIAGGVPNLQKPTDNVRVGDIVVSDARGVIQYDFDRETEGVTEPHPYPRPPGAYMSEAVRLLQARALLGNKPWEPLLRKAIGSLGAIWSRPSADRDPYAQQHPIDSERDVPEYPKVFVGPIASANKLLKNPIKRDALRDKYGVKAVEMEGSGIADATWNLEAHYLVIRGVVDYCDSSKGDAWHYYASLAAAAYSRALVEVL